VGIGGRGAYGNLCCRPRVSCALRRWRRRRLCSARDSSHRAELPPSLWLSPFRRVVRRSGCVGIAILRMRLFSCPTRFSKRLGGLFGRTFDDIVGELKDCDEDGMAYLLSCSITFRYTDPSCSRFSNDSANRREWYAWLTSGATLGHI